MQLAPIPIKFPSRHGDFAPVVIAVTASFDGSLDPIFDKCPFDAPLRHCNGPPHGGHRHFFRRFANHPRWKVFVEFQVDPVTIAKSLELKVIALIDAKVIANMDVAFVIGQADLIVRVTDQLAYFTTVGRENV